MVSPDEAFQVLLEVTRVLDELEVPYVVGGSLASFLHGIPRSTQDADLVAALLTDHIQSFIGRVEGVFYLSRAILLQLPAPVHLETLGT